MKVRHQSLLTYFIGETIAQNSATRVISLGLLVFFSVQLTACSLFKHRIDDQNDEAPQEEAAPEAVSVNNTEPGNSSKEVQNLKQLIESLNQRVQTLDDKLVAMNEKINATQTGWNAFVGTQKIKTKAVLPHPSENRGEKVTSLPTSQDPEAGYQSDEAVDMYKKANILFESKKYPEAVLGFSNFLRDYAEHPLGGSAQYYIGESYYKQNEYKLAIKELEKVLISYDRSSYIPETLKRIAEAEDQLQLVKEAGEHRHLLLSLFPQSPAAKSIAHFSITESKNAPLSAPIQKNATEEVDDLEGSE